MKSLFVHFGGFKLARAPFRACSNPYLVFLDLSFFGRNQVRKFYQYEDVDRMRMFLLLSCKDNQVIREEAAVTSQIHTS